MRRPLPVELIDFRPRSRQPRRLSPLNWKSKPETVEVASPKSRKSSGVVPLCVHDEFMLSVLMLESSSCNKSETLVDYL